MWTRQAERCTGFFRLRTAAKIQNLQRKTNFFARNGQLHKTLDRTVSHVRGFGEYGESKLFIWNISLFILLEQVVAARSSPLGRSHHGRDRLSRVRPVQDRANQAQRLHKQIIPFDNVDLVNKIHQTYKVQYIQDVILPAPSVFEENSLASLTSFIFLNKVEISNLIQVSLILDLLVRVLDFLPTFRLKMFHRNRKLKKKIYIFCILKRRSWVFFLQI